MLKIASILLLTVTIAIAGCEWSAPPRSALPLPVRLAYTTQHDCALVHLALLKGFFSQEGLVVQPLMRPFGKEALADVLQGKADLATVAETPFMFAVLKGEPISVVAGIFSSSKNNAIIVNRKMGINKASDLRGKRIAVTPGTTSQFFLHSFLLANNIQRHELAEVAMNPDEMPGAVMSGRVDAASTWNPTLKTISSSLKEQGALFFDRNIYTQTFVLTARSEYIRRNPEVVRRMLRALLKAEQFASEHAGEAQALIASAVHMDRELLRACWSESRFGLSLDQSLLIALEDETRWAIKNRLVRGASMPNYLGHLSFDGLRAVRPEAITIEK